jgi:hypothetical protein
MLRGQEMRLLDHTLAKLALSVREEDYWRLEFPPCIQDLVLAESGNI